MKLHLKEGNSWPTQPGIERHGVKKLYYSSTQICAPFTCQRSGFLSAHEEMAKDLEMSLKVRVMADASVAIGIVPRKD